jgi:anti-sigma factor RsiW
MKHPEAQQWIDYVRGTLAKDDAARIKAHLDTGCKACRMELALWAAMKDFGSQEPGNAPPADTVRVVKAAVGGKAGKVRTTMREIAELVFDSYSQPQFAGVRSSSDAPRQLLYRAGSMMIDMRLQNGQAADRIALMGQVFSSGEKKLAMRQVPVHLLSGVDELASTATNQFGEFYLEHESGRDLQISVEVSTNRDVFIPLDESIWRIASSR